MGRDERMGKLSILSTELCRAQITNPNCRYERLNPRKRILFPRPGKEIQATKPRLGEFGQHKRGIGEPTREQRVSTIFDFPDLDRPARRALEDNGTALAGTRLRSGSHWAGWRE
jgi:hypothetical protein